MYTRGSHMLEYFVPRGTTPLGKDDLSASGAVHGGMVCVKRCQVKRIMFVVETEIAADSTAPAVEFNRRPTIASATGEEAIGTLTIPDATEAGEVIYKDITPVTFEVGDELSFEHTTQAADAGTPAGEGYYAALAVDDPENPENEDNMTESA